MANEVSSCNYNKRILPFLFYEMTAHRLLFSTPAALPGQYLFVFTAFSSSSAYGTPRCYVPWSSSCHCFYFLHVQGRGLSLTRFSWVGDECAFNNSHLIYQAKAYTAPLPQAAAATWWFCFLSQFCYFAFPVALSSLLSQHFKTVILLLALIQQLDSLAAIISLALARREQNPLHGKALLP